jgi:hypothetical protein
LRAADAMVATSQIVCVVARSAVPVLQDLDAADAVVLPENRGAGHVECRPASAGAAGLSVVMNHYSYEILLIVIKYLLMFFRIF